MRKFTNEPVYKLSRKSDPVTSKTKIKTQTLQEIVYLIISSYENGCILDQVLAKMTRLKGRISTSSVSSRFCELERAGLIEYNGMRKGLSGKYQRVARAK